MKLNESHGVRRTPKVPAGEILHAQEEPEFKFDPRVHLTDQDWEKAGESLEEFRKEPDPSTSGLQLQASLLRLNPVRFRQLMNQLPEEVRDWYVVLGKDNNNLIENEINNTALNHKIRAYLKIQAREVYPDHQPPFVLSAQDRKKLIELFKPPYSIKLPCFRALALSSVLLRFPGEESNLGKDPSLILDEAGWQVIMDQTKRWLNTKIGDANEFGLLVSQLVEIRTVSPEQFSQLTLDKTFWDHALKYTQKVHADPRWFITARLSYAEELYILSAAEVHINSTGVLVVEAGVRTNLKPATSLPVRDVS